MNLEFYHYNNNHRTAHISIDNNIKYENKYKINIKIKIMLQPGGPFVIWGLTAYLLERFLHDVVLKCSGQENEFSK